MDFRFPSFMTCSLKVDTKCPGWHVSLLKVLKSMSGVKYSIDAEKGMVQISGNIDPDKILRLLESSGKHAELSKLDSGFNHSHGDNIPNSVPSNFYDYGGYNYNGYGGGHRYDRPYGSLDQSYRYSRQQPHYYYTYYEPQQPPTQYYYPQQPLPPSLNPYVGEPQCSIM